MLNDSYFINYPKLESERLIFRALTLSDAPDIYEIRSNDEVLKYLDSKKHESVHESKAFIQNGLDTNAKQEGLFWAIIEKSTGKMIGDFSFWRIDRKNHRAEIGYTLKPDFWRKGFMSEAIMTLTKFGFSELNLHSFEANINPENGNSKFLLLKSGFKKEAYFRENYYFNGQYLDSEIYSLIEVES